MVTLLNLLTTLSKLPQGKSGGNGDLIKILLSPVDRILFECGSNERLNGLIYCTSILFTNHLEFVERNIFGDLNNAVSDLWSVSLNAVAFVLETQHIQTLLNGV